MAPKYPDDSPPRRIAGPMEEEEASPPASSEFAGLTLHASDDVATPEREGDSLIFMFENGKQVVLEHFYAVEDKANLPDFHVGGALVAGSDFFAPLEPLLIPHEAAPASENSALQTGDVDGATAETTQHAPQNKEGKDSSG